MILIAGVGNPYRGDDGVGIEIIKILHEQTNPNMVLFDAGTDGFSLLDQLALYPKALIVDAVFMGEKPGTVKIFTPKEAKLIIKNDALSTHGFGLAEILKLVDELALKTAIKIVGIEPENISFGEGLSQVVISKLPKILELVHKEII